MGPSGPAPKAPRAGKLGVAADLLERDVAVAGLFALVNARLGHLRVIVTNDKDGREQTEEHLLRSFMIAICNGRPR